MFEEVKKKNGWGNKFLLVDVREEANSPGTICQGRCIWAKGIIERDIEARVPDLASKLCFLRWAIPFPR